MLRPSYTDLLEGINKDAEGEDIVGSRYTIVIAAAKRARQLVDNAQPLTKNLKVDKPVSIAVNELYENQITIIPYEEKETEKNSDSIQTVEETFDVDYNDVD